MNSSAAPSTGHLSHYPRNGETYMRAQCGSTSLSSTMFYSAVTCEDCKALIVAEDLLVRESYDSDEIKRYSASLDASI